jgi:hypothetical protein
MTNVDNYENIIAGSIGGILLLIGLRICYKNPDCTFFSRDDDNNENDDDNDNAPPSPTSVTHLFNAGKIKKTKKNKKQKKGKTKKHHNK